MAGIDVVVGASDDSGLVRLGSNVQIEIARKNLEGKESAFFFGHNLALGTSYEDINPEGGDYPWQQGGSTVEVVSTNAADTSTGLGLRSVEVHGLSTLGVDQVEVIALNGTTPAVSVNTYCRINQMHSETCGTYGGSHQGDITLRVSGGGDTLASMQGDEGATDSSVQYGYGESNSGHYSVPLGKIMYITRVEVIPNVATNKTVSVALYEREDILNLSAPFTPRRVVWSGDEFNSVIEKELTSYIKIKPLTDIWFRGKGSASSKVEVWVDFFLLDENSRNT